MKSRAVRLAFAIGLALAQRAWAGDTFEAVLVGSNEVPEPGMAEGSFAAVVVVEGTKVTLTLTPKGLRGWMSAHIHKGAAGVAGKLVTEFPWRSGDSSPRIFVDSIPANVAADLIANPGKYYVDVHTPDFSAGAARGQLAARANAEAPPGPRPVAKLGFTPRVGPGLGAPLAAMPPGPMSPLLAERLRASNPSRPLFLSPSNSAYAHFFGHLAELDELAGDDDAAGRDAQASEKRQREARAARLTEREGSILKEVAYECNRALAPLEAKIQASRETPGPWPEGAQVWDERSRIAGGCVVQLRARLGEGAFADLDSYVAEHFGGAVNAQEVPAPSPKRDQSISFSRVRRAVYRDPDFRLNASASSGLRIFFTASGDCTVYGATVHILSAGKCWVTAHQPGDARFEAALDVEQQIAIEKASQRIDGAAPEFKTYLDPDFPLAMSATSGLAIVFSAWGDCSVDGPYVHITGAGTCSFTAHQPGDSNYLAARIVDQQFPIAKADQTIEFGGFPNPYFGTDTLPLYARASSGLPVAFSVSGPCQIAGSWVRVYDSGQCWVTADQGGDRNFNAAPPVTSNFVVVFPTPTPP